MFHMFNFFIIIMKWKTRLIAYVLDDSRIKQSLKQRTRKIIAQNLFLKWDT